MAGWPKGPRYAVGDAVRVYVNGAWRDGEVTQASRDSVAVRLPGLGAVRHLHRSAWSLNLRRARRPA